MNYLPSNSSTSLILKSLLQHLNFDLKSNNNTSVKYGPEEPSQPQHLNFYLKTEDNTSVHYLPEEPSHPYLHLALTKRSHHDFPEFDTNPNTLQSWLPTTLN